MWGREIRYNEQNIISYNQQQKMGSRAVYEENILKRYDTRNNTRNNTIRIKKNAYIQ
jgi:hypothetical protein